ncbi:uncharacterized protein [Amphiura filiformis]
MTGDVIPLLLAIACLFLTPAISLPSKTGTARDISHTDIERLILNTIETVEAQAINRKNGGTNEDEVGGTPWKAENTWKTPTLPDLIKDWKESVKERQESLAGNDILRDIPDADAALNDKRSRDYGWGMAFGKRGSRTQNERHKLESRNKEYGWGTFFGKRNEYGWGHMFGKRDAEEVDYDDFVA